jgi:hypothetical protein
MPVFSAATPGCTVAFTNLAAAVAIAVVGSTLSFPVRPAA